jgi:Domain of unknown function (DUF929)
MEQHRDDTPIDRAEAEAAASGDEHEPDAAPPAAPVLAPVTHRSRTSLLTWATVALVLVIVVVLVGLKITGSSGTSTSSSPPPPQPASAGVVQAVTAIPASVYDAVGVTSSDGTVTPPSLLAGQPPLTYGGKPGVLFVANEFCPYCAAERWAVVAALSRFGRLSGLDAMQSGSNEAFPGTPTFTFVTTRYKSSYLGAKFVEHFSDQKNAAGTAYTVLEPLSRATKALVARYGRATPTTPAGTVPFLDIANQAVAAGANFSPAVFQQLSASQIAAGLTDAKAPATQAIVATANYLSAVICSVDGGRPGAVCTSKGVVAADSALGLKP